MYFWENEDDAIFCGVKFKNKTGRYDVYSAEISLKTSWILYSKSQFP
jgi:hypothetical protein